MKLKLLICIYYKEDKLNTVIKIIWSESAINENLKKYALPSTLENLKILPAQLGNDAGIIGAAYLGMN